MGRELLKGAWEGQPRPRMKGQMEFSASSFPTKHSCSCFETLQVEGLVGVPIAEIGRLLLRFPHREGEKIFSSLKRNPNLDVYGDKIN